MRKCVVEVFYNGNKIGEKVVYSRDIEEILKFWNGNGFIYKKIKSCPIKHLPLNLERYYIGPFIAFMEA